jgi:hypothetical protein
LQLPANLFPAKKASNTLVEHNDQDKTKKDPGNGRNRTAVGSALLDFNLHNDTCYHYTTSPLACQRFESGWPDSGSWGSRMMADYMSLVITSARGEVLSKASL